jgi:murein DD-endopeptidase MepM/ murein hydrolase activator NlpD
LGTLLLPAISSSAGPQRRLANTRSQLSRVRRQLEADQSAAGTLRGRIEVLERNINDLQIELNRLESQIAAIKSDVNDAQTRVRATEADIHQIQERATQEAAALYKAGSTNVLDVLLSSKSLAELDTRVEMLGAAAEQNTTTLIRYGRLKVGLEEQYRQLFAKQTELADREADRKKLFADMSSEKTELSRDYAQTLFKVHDEKDREQGLEADSRELEKLIQAAQAKRAVENLGESAQGFIWPLNGPITSPYGPRWGSFHTGVDIGGVTGQPIVASKAGKVIMASYYGGYGNAIIIDHGGGMSTLYGHMSGFAVSGGSVDQGEVIGYVGCTGHCTGPHLHFEVRVNGSPVDPMPYLP